MTTATWTAVTDHTSDAGFRAWGDLFSSKLQAVGLVQTADTGQINWATVNRAGINTTAGHEIYYLPGSLHATAPIYIKVEYATGSVAPMGVLRFTVGTGSNGSGTLTGTALTANTAINSSYPDATIGYQSYMCATEGFFGFYWNSASGGRGAFFVCRSVDAAGAFTGEGATVYWGNSSGSLQDFRTLRFAAPASAGTSHGATSAGYCVVPNSPASSLVGSDFQVYQHWMATPRVRPNICLCTYVNSEINLGSTFSATMAGATAHTYIAMGRAISADVTGSALYSVAMLWE